MANTQQIGHALLAADAAGDTENARYLAQVYQSMQQQSDQPADNPPAPHAAPNPTQDMSTYQRFMAGAGRSVVETGRGLHQVGAAIADAIPGVDLRDYRQKLQTDIDDAKQRDKPLMETGAGQAGSFTGELAQLMLPMGVASKGSLAARALLPKTIAGNALQGGVIAMLQPTASNENRLNNTLMGAAAGGGLSGLMKLVGTGSNALMQLMQSNITPLEKNAGSVLLREAANPDALKIEAPSSIPGVQRTLAEETLDPGIARLERTIRSSGGQFDAIDRANNAARVKALETFAQDENALNGAKVARNEQTEPLRKVAMTDTGVKTDSLKNDLAEAIQRHATRPPVQRALMDVQDSINQAGDDVFSLYGTRKYIDDLLSGKAGIDKSYAKVATHELMQIKGQLDKHLAEASPTFEQYLQRYRDLSEPINRMEIGQKLIGQSSRSALRDPVTGLNVLTPAQFSKASQSLDKLAGKALGFKKAKAEDILRPGDIMTIKAIQDDLRRQAIRATAGSGGNSQTFERMDTASRVWGTAKHGLLKALPGGHLASSFLDVLNKTRNDQLKEKLAYLIANPDEARRVIGNLPQKGKGIVTQALTQIGGKTGQAGEVTMQNNQ